jgi:hypothetical protein
MNLVHNTLIKGSILGGIVLFIWSAISWMALPWHNATLNRFANEDSVAELLKTSTSERGIYIYPGEADTLGMSPDEQKKAQQATWDKMKMGPIVFMSINPRGSESMGKFMAVGLLTQIIVAFLMTYLLLRTKEASFWSKVRFIVLLSFLSGLICYLPQWNWWHFSTPYTLVAFGDLLIGGFLVGMVLAQTVDGTIPGKNADIDQALTS